MEIQTGKCVCNVNTYMIVSVFCGQHAALVTVRSYNYIYIPIKCNTFKISSVITVQYRSISCKFLVSNHDLEYLI